MRYIDLSKPHGYLIWKGKQKAIVSPTPLPIEEKILVIQEGQEAFGELVLSTPAQINLTEFERLEYEHGVRAEERKLNWGSKESFYLYHFKEWLPYLESKEIEIENGYAEILPEIMLSSAEKELLEKAERLPKTLILKDNAVILEDGKAIFCEGLDGSNIMPILSTYLDNKEVKETLPLYQLALVRIPKLKLKKNMEINMDNEDVVLEGEKGSYKVVSNHSGCKEEGKSVGLEIDGELEDCFESADMAESVMEEKGRASGRSRGNSPKKTSSPNKPSKNQTSGMKEGMGDVETDEKGVDSLERKAVQIREAFYEAFNPKPPSEPDYKPQPWVKEVYDDHVCIGYDGKLYSAGYTKDENGDIKFADKSKWVELEVLMVPTGKVGAKGIMEGYDESAKSFSEWVDDYYAFSDKAIIELDEEEAVKAVWSTAFVNGLPNSSFLHIVPGCGENDDEGKTKPRSCRMFPYKDAEGNVDLPHLRNAIARAPQATTIPEDVRKKVQKRAQSILAEQNGEKSGKKIQKNMLTKLKSAWETLKELMDWAEPSMEEDDMAKGYGIAIKKVGDEEWYLTYSTNAFKDREQEIFSTKSLETYVAESAKQEDKGYFNFWHIENTDFAEKKWQGVVGRFLVEAGPFLKNNKGKAALKFFSKHSKGHPDLAPEGWGCSPEYKYLTEERKKGIYENIWITRTSTLPKMAAANIHTLGGNVMALTKEQQKALTEIFGEDESKSIISVAETKTKDLEEAGVAHKEIEPKEETPLPGEIEVPEGFAELVAKQFDIQWKSLGEVLAGIAERQKTFETEILELKKELSAETKEAAKKAKDESPKYVFKLFERASEAEKTIVSDEDPLKDKKPVEAAKSNGDAASAFFGRK